MTIEELKDKKIVILGFGKEGRDSFKFLRKLFPKKKIGIADQKFSKDYLKRLKDYDLIIKSPGVPIHLPEIEKAFKEGKITSQTEIFFNNQPGKIVGVTGTKGKSTTASMIYQVLKAGLKLHPVKFASQTFNRVNLVGNIGKPVLSFLFNAKPEDVYVCELSSHQLYNLKKSPQIAVFLNIYPEHLDYYRNFKEYANAKANIALYQKKDDYLVYNAQDKIVKEIVKKSKTESRNSGTKVKMKTKFSSPAKKIPIKGEYYELNKAAARAVGKIFKVPSKIIERAIKKFKYLPHRLELVGTFKGITFYNDALATIPEATIAAMKILGNRIETIMLGGFDRNIDFKKLAQKVLRSKIKTMIFFPTTGEKIWRDIMRQNKKKKAFNHFFVNNMEKAVKLAYQHTGTGKICLLSTASSSFSIFKDYKKKGDLFKKQVFAQQKRRWR